MTAFIFQIHNRAPRWRADNGPSLGAAAAPISPCRGRRLRRSHVVRSWTGGDGAAAALKRGSLFSAPASGARFGIRQRSVYRVAGGI